MSIRRLLVIWIVAAMLLVAVAHAVVAWMSPGAQESRSAASAFFGCDDSRESDCG